MRDGWRRHRTILRLPILLLALSLLFAQGLRVCWHTLDTAGAGSSAATAAHLESDLPHPGPADNATDDLHIRLGLALVKQLADASTLVLPTALFLLLPRPAHRLAVSRVVTPILPPGHRTRPPLRAPPR